MMSTRQRIPCIGTVLLILAVISCHCTSWFGSATLRITYYLEDGLYYVKNEVQKAEVDLREHEDWQAHHEDIKGISRILFAFWVINPSAGNATAQFYVSTDCSLTTPQEITEGAILVLDGICVPPQDSVYISAQDSYRYFRNVDELSERLIEGQFCLYCIAQEAPFEIEVPEGAALVVDFTYAVDWEF